jgi:hypothetical protein
MASSSSAVSEELKDRTIDRVFSLLMQSGGVSGRYNLPQIKEIAAENKDAFPSLFMRTFMMTSYYHIFLHRLDLNDEEIDSYDYEGDINCFVEAFSWFVNDFGSGSTTPGYHCNGGTKKGHTENFRKTSIAWTNHYFSSEGKCSSEALARLDVNCANTMVNCFIDILPFRRGIEQYILRACFETDTQSEHCRWEKLQCMLARCRCDLDQQDDTISNVDSPAPSQRFVTSEEGAPKDEASGSCSLPGHSLIWILMRPAQYGVPFDASNVKRCLHFIKKHQPTVFLVRNQEGRSLLDVILRASNSSPVNSEGGSEHILTRQDWEELAFFVLEEDPKACLIPDLDGNRALDIVFRSQNSPGLFKAVAAASASLSSSRCMLKSCQARRLYPFQLAATTETFWRPTSPAEDTSKIYQLLRQTPDLIKSEISVLPCDAVNSVARSLMPLIQTTSTSLTPKDGDNKKRKALETQTIS